MKPHPNTVVAGVCILTIVKRALRVVALLAMMLGAWKPILVWALPSGVDVVGPDGITYPNFTYAGVRGGIPGGPTTVITLTTASASSDLAAAIESAAASATQGAVIKIPSGTYALSRPVLIPQNNIVLRGTGSNSTIIQFTYQAPSGQSVNFYQPAPAVNTIYCNTWIQMHADPVNLVEMHLLAGTSSSTLIECNGMVKQSGYWGNPFSLATSGSSIISKAGTGAIIVQAKAVYYDGINYTTQTTNRTFTVVNSISSTALPAPYELAAINFLGAGYIPGDCTYKLARGASRGETTLTLTTTASGIAAGDAIVLDAPPNPVFNATTGNTCTTSALFRQYQFQVTTVSGAIITLNQPLRIDYPIEVDTNVTPNVTYTPVVRKFIPLTGCAVENLTLQQLNDVWTCGIAFSWAWDCWTKNITVNKPGRHPVWMSPAKFCTISNCVFNDAWYKGENGTAYVGFERAYDNLMDNVTSSKLRHGPLVQWSAAGNVFRNCTFNDSDAHWHAGWSNENLYDNCTIISNLGNGSYGNGLYSSAPNDTQHGPNGPRNTVYNCDVSSPKQSVILNGSNKGYLLAHSRFAADLGENIFAQKASSDHTIQNNVFVSASSSGGINLSTVDCTGIKVISNTFSGLYPLSSLVYGLTQTSTLSANLYIDNMPKLDVTGSPSNGGFELGTFTGWTVAGGGTATVIGGGGAEGSAYYVRLTETASSNGTYLYGKTFAVTPGIPYIVNFFSRTVSGVAGSAGVYIYFYNSTGAEIAYGIKGINGQSTWAADAVCVVAPPNAVTAKVCIHPYYSQVCTVDVDELTFSAVPTLAWTVAPVDTSFDLATSSAPSTCGWLTTADKGMSTIIADPSDSTNNVLQVSDSNTTLGSWLYTPRFAATPGYTYQIRIWAQNVSGSGIGLYLSFYDGNGSSIGNQNVLSLPVDTARKQYTLRAVAPVGTVQAQCYIHSYMASQVVEYFDDPVIVEIPPRPQPPFPSLYDWQMSQ